MWVLCRRDNIFRRVASICIQPFSRCDEWGRLYEAIAIVRNTLRFFRQIRSTSDARFRTDFGQMWIRLCPGGVGMACRGPRIRESVLVRTEGREAVDWACLTKVRSGRPSHNRTDENEGLEVEWWLIRTWDWIWCSKGHRGVRHVSGPCFFLVATRVSRQLATWQGPRLGGPPRTISRRELGLREWVLQMWWRACRRRWRISGRNPDMIAPERHWFRPSIGAGPGLRQRVYLCLRVGLVGISTNKCSRPLSVPMDGMMWQQHCSCCLTWKGTPWTWPCWFRLFCIIRWQKCGDYPCLSRIHLIFWIQATRTYVLGCRGRETASGMWNWSVTLHS